MPEQVRFTREEKRNIFKGMVVSELESGFLRYSKRQALIRYAAGLNIPEFEACLLMAEAQYNADDIEPADLNPAKVIERIEKPAALSLGQRLGIILAVAVFIDLIIIWWIL